MGARGSIDSPFPGGEVRVPFLISGWAADSGSKSGSGVDRVLLYDGDRSAVNLLGTASYSVARLDVAKFFANREMLQSGFEFIASSLSLGQHTLQAWAHSTVMDDWYKVGDLPLTVVAGKGVVRRIPAGALVAGLGVILSIPLIAAMSKARN